MKDLFKLNLIVSILLPIAWFGFTLFLSGGCIIPIVTPLMTYIFAFILLCLTGLTPLLLLINPIAMIVKWKTFGKRLLLSLILIIIGVIVTVPLNHISHTFARMRFEKFLPQYEQAVVEIEKDPASKAHNTRPRGWRRLAIFPPTASREKDGTLTVVFLVGGIGPPPRHVAYIYRSNGVIEKDSLTAQQWHWPVQVNEHWFRAAY